VQGKTQNSDRREGEIRFFAVTQDQATAHTVANLGPSNQGIGGQSSYADPSSTEESFSISPCMEAIEAEALNKIGTSHVDTTMGRAENLRWEDCPYFEDPSASKQEANVHSPAHSSNEHETHRNRE